MDGLLVALHIGEVDGGTRAALALWRIRRWRSGSLATGEIDGRDGVALHSGEVDGQEWAALQNGEVDSEIRAASKIE